jgi:hypothetical protein
MKREAAQSAAAVVEAGNTPPDTGGVAAASRKGGEAHLSAADGVVDFESTLSVSDHPGRSIKGGLATFFLVSRPPLLYQEGSWATQQ